MGAINTVIIEGNLTVDPEVRGEGGKVATFAVANNEVYVSRGEKQEVVNYVDVKVLGEKSVKFISEYYKKGSGVIVQGKIRTESWENNEGQKRSRNVVYAEKLSFGPSRPRAESNEGKKANAQDTGIDTTVDEDVPF